jgi:serine/threonine protein kinase
VTGQTLGHYRILEKLGAGGMGEVYRARDERLGRDVAIKLLPSNLVADEFVRKRLRKEAQALSKLNHPNIEILFELGSKEDTEFLVVEHVPGVTLDDRLVQGPLPEREIARLGAQLANGLAAAHRMKGKRLINRYF